MTAVHVFLKSIVSMAENLFNGKEFIAFLHVFVRMALIVSAFRGKGNCLREESKSKHYYWETLLFCSFEYITQKVMLLITWVVDFLIS